MTQLKRTVVPTGDALKLSNFDEGDIVVSGEYKGFEVVKGKKNDFKVHKFIDEKGIEVSLFGTTKLDTGLANAARMVDGGVCMVEITLESKDKPYQVEIALLG